MTRRIGDSAFRAQRGVLATTFLLALPCAACACTQHQKPEQPIATPPPAVARKPNDTTSTPAPAPPDTKESEPVPTEPLAQALQLLQRIARSPALDKASIEALLGVKLQPLPTQPQERLEYEAALRSGPFARVELHEPRPQQAKFWLVSLDVRAGVELRHDAFMQQKLIPPATPVSMEPNGPPGGSITYEVHERSGQNFVYEFNGDTWMLRGAAVHRGYGIP